MKYRIYVNEELTGATDWLPIAQAAWDRASRDRDGAQHGWDATLTVDGNVAATVRPRTGDGHAWPIQADPVVGPRDVAKAILALARKAGVSAKDLAEEMGKQGLPTNPARLKSISTLEQGRRTHVSDAELVAICYAAIAALPIRQ